MIEETTHKTVLLREAVDALNLEEGMTVVDATLGGGGHSLEVLKKIGKDGKLIAFDRDDEAISRFRKRIEAGEAGLSGKKSITLFHDNFTALEDRLVSIGIPKVDAIIADLGISSDQLADERRGISFQADSPLDMRMDQTKGITAQDVVNTYAEQDLAKILKENADERYAVSIARRIVSERASKPITRTTELVDLVGHSVPGEYKRKKIHFATKTFQALRMEVNRESESLGSFLSQAVESLRIGGRLAVITFHSGEDAIVKTFLKENARGCICPPEFPVCQCDNKASLRVVTRKPIIPGEEEIERNPRSRSAKLRVAERVRS